MSSRARDVANLVTIVASKEDLDERIFISSASPAIGNIDGRLWVDTTTASAPVLQVYGGNEFKNTRISRIKALGGNITEVGPYRIHEFLSDGTFTALEPLTIEYLVIAGGGSGGSGDGGGGGAGGYRTGSLSGINGQTYAVTIGAGGAAIPGTSSPGNNGSNSVFDSITSIGGGGGGRTGAGSNGGSGGGGGGSNATNSSGGTATAGQGFNGGAGGSSSGQGAGGGGAGGAGPKATALLENPGGIGLESSITGISVIRAAGGVGDSSSNPAASGMANTGTGGNGRDASAGTSGGGGSGIVIVRYLI